MVVNFGRLAGIDHCGSDREDSEPRRRSRAGSSTDASSQRSPPGPSTAATAPPTDAHIAAVQRTLALGPPSGLSLVLSELNQKKKYRVGYTKLVQQILAR